MQVEGRILKAKNQDRGMGTREWLHYRRSGRGLEVSSALSLDTVWRPISRGGGRDPGVSVWRFGSGAAGVSVPWPPAPSP